eukprot:g32959.t1
MAEHRDSVAQAEIDLDGDFTLEELEECFEQAQFGKACGSDETRHEMFKCGGATMRQLLLRVFNFLRDIETTPDDWGMGTLVNLYKDGDPADLGNYRGIALTSCLGQLYLSLWARRLSGFMEGKLSEEQGGFRPNRSTTDHTISLHEALARRKLTRRSTHLFFVGFRKAFDTVWQDGLWERLWQSGIRGRAWRIIRDAYRGIRMRVLVDGCLTQPVPVAQGVRQGDPLSPVLFLIFIDALAEMLAERCKGLAYCPEGPATRRQLRSLLYADDVVMLAESPEELNAMIEVVRSFCDTWRIEINLAKSQVMEVHPRGVCRKAEGYYYGFKAIEVVKQYKYLGLTLTDTLSWDAHYERALAKARKGHVALARLFARREIPFAAKRAMWTTTTLSSLEYRAENRQTAQIRGLVPIPSPLPSKTAASPVCDGFVLHKGVQESKFGGDALDELVEQILFVEAKKELHPQYCTQKRLDATGKLVARQISFPDTTRSFHRWCELDLLQDIKHNICRVSDKQLDLTSGPNFGGIKIPKLTYELPDGSVLSTEMERFMPYETLFFPKQVQQQGHVLSASAEGFVGLQQMAYEAIQACDVDLYKELLPNLVLTGGVSLTPGLRSRVERELQKKFPATGSSSNAANKVKAVGPSSNERRFSVWVGGSILGSLGTFHQMWVSKMDYQEHGANVLARHCP